MLWYEQLQILYSKFTETPSPFHSGLNVTLILDLTYIQVMSPQFHTSESISVWCDKLQIHNKVIKHNKTALYVTETRSGLNVTQIGDV